MTEPEKREPHPSGGFISASQVDAFLECPRRWHAHYVEGEPREPETPSTQRGTRVHKILELYDKEGIKIDATTEDGLIALQAEPYLFEPKTGIAEFEFNLDAVGVKPSTWWTYTGKVDWLREDGRFVRDYKTTSDFKYAKSEEVLKTNPQVILYGAVALELQGSEKYPVDFSWLYLRTKKPKALERAFSMPAYDIRREKDNLDAFVENEMLPTRKLPLLSLPPNPKACFKYNKPCPYKHRCTDLNPLTLLKGSISSMTQDEIMARLKSNTLGGPVSQVAPAQQSLPSLAGLPKLNSPGVTTPPPPQEATDNFEEADEAEAESAEVNPFDLLGTQLGVARNQGEDDMGYMLRLTQAQAKSVGINTEKRGPGRPPGSKNKATIEKEEAEKKAKEAKALQEAEAERLTREAEAKALAAAEAERQKTLADLRNQTATIKAEAKTLEGQAVDTKDGIPLEDQTVTVNAFFFPCLYINCLPVGQDVLDFAYVAQAANATIEKELGLPHYSLIDYGKGKGAFLMAVKKLLEEELTSDSVRPVCVDTRNSEGSDCLNLLVSMSAQQVRGIR